MRRLASALMAGTLVLGTAGVASAAPPKRPPPPKKLNCAISVAVHEHYRSLLRGALAADCTDYYTSSILIQLQLVVAVYDPKLKADVWQSVGKSVMDVDGGDTNALTVTAPCNKNGSYAVRYVVGATPTSKASVQAGTKQFSLRNVSPATPLNCTDKKPGPAPGSSRSGGGGGWGDGG